MSLTPQEPRESPAEVAPAASGGSRWPVILLVVVVVLAAWVAYEHRARTDVTARLQQANNKLAQLESRAATLEDNYANLRAQFDVTGERLGLTQQELSRARSLANQIKEDQRRAAEQLGTRIEQQRTELGSLTGEVGQVKGDVAATREAIEQTRVTLERTIGDLGVQSGLIASSRDELEALKRRGDRDYIEFNLKKSKQFTRLGAVSLRLNKTDLKRQRYTMTLLADDRSVEKKDKTLLEPVQHYLKGTRYLLEVVVFEVNKDAVSGYVSVPKEVAMKR